MATAPSTSASLGDNGSSPLHRAVLAGNIEEAARLIEEAGLATGALLDTTWRTTPATPHYAAGLMPLHVAAVAGKLAAMQLLLQRGANVNALSSAGKQQTALMLAVQAKRLACIQLLLAVGASTSACDAQGMSALGHAAAAVSPPCVAALLDAGAAATGDMILGLASKADGGAAICVELLLLSGAGLQSAVTQGGNTALHVAALRNSEALIAVLLDHGANPALLNERGQSAQQVAKAHGCRDAETMLRRFSDGTLYTEPAFCKRMQRLKATREAGAREARQQAAAARESAAPQAAEAKAAAAAHAKAAKQAAADKKRAAKKAAQRQRKQAAAATGAVSAAPHPPGYGREVAKRAAKTAVEGALKRFEEEQQAAEKKKAAEAAQAAERAAAVEAAVAAAQEEAREQALEARRGELAALAALRQQQEEEDVAQATAASLVTHTAPAAPATGEPEAPSNTGTSSCRTQSISSIVANMPAMPPPTPAQARAAMYRDQLELSNMLAQPLAIEAAEKLAGEQGMPSVQALVDAHGLEELALQLEFKKAQLQQQQQEAQQQEAPQGPPPAQPQQAIDPAEPSAKPSSPAADGAQPAAAPPRQLPACAGDESAGASSQSPPACAGNSDEDASGSGRSSPASPKRAPSPSSPCSGVDAKQHSAAGAAAARQLGPRVEQPPAEEPQQPNLSELREHRRLYFERSSSPEPAATQAEQPPHGDGAPAPQHAGASEPPQAAAHADAPPAQPAPTPAGLPRQAATLPGSDQPLQPAQASAAPQLQAAAQPAADPAADAELAVVLEAAGLAGFLPQLAQQQMTLADVAETAPRDLVDCCNIPLGPAQQIIRAAKAAAPA